MSNPPDFSAFQREPVVVETQGHEVAPNDRPTLTPREAGQEAAGQNADSPLVAALNRCAVALERLNAQLETGATITDNATGRPAAMSIGNAIALMAMGQQQPQRMVVPPQPGRRPY